MSAQAMRHRSKSFDGQPAMAIGLRQETPSLCPWNNAAMLRSNRGTTCKPCPRRTSFRASLQGLTRQSSATAGGSGRGHQCEKVLVTKLTCNLQRVAVGSIGLVRWFGVNPPTKCGDAALSVSRTPIQVLAIIFSGRASKNFPDSPESRRR